MGDKNTQEDGVVLVDLCHAPDEVLTMILKRVPAKELLKACTQVSKQWHRVLSAKFFWKEKLEEVDGYKLPWAKLAGESMDFYQKMAIEQPFLRNFIRDSWDLTKCKRKKDCCQLDMRWQINNYFMCSPHRKLSRYNLRIEVPPIFSTQPAEKMGPEFVGEPVLACLATSKQKFSKRIGIRLASQGLTNELMDSYRPTIVVSELVANRLDCASQYRMDCHLWDGTDTKTTNIENSEQIEADILEEANDHCVGFFRRKRFKQGEAECWHLVRHEFKQYPAGMRNLVLQVDSVDEVRLARCSMMALCEGNNNALEAEEEIIGAVQSTKT